MAYVNERVYDLCTMLLAMLIMTMPVEALGPSLAPVPVAHYRGGLLGVTANVYVCRSTKSAAIRLSGVPIGGPCSGQAYMDAEGRVTVNDPLASKLARRGVAVEAVDVGVNERQLWVRLMLPLGLGRMTMPLKRVTNEMVGVLESAR